MSPDHHLGELNTTQQGERDRRASVASKDRKNQKREKAEEKGSRGNGEDEENGCIVEGMTGNCETTRVLGLKSQAKQLQR